MCPDCRTAPECAIAPKCAKRTHFSEDAHKLQHRKSLGAGSVQQSAPDAPATISGRHGGARTRKRGFKPVFTEIPCPSDHSQPAYNSASEGWVFPPSSSICPEGSRALAERRSEE